MLSFYGRGKTKSMSIEVEDEKDIGGVIKAIKKKIDSINYYREEEYDDEEEYDEEEYDDEEGYE